MIHAIFPQIVELESEITTLSETSRLDQAKLHQLGVRLSEMEAVNRAYMDRIHELEMRDLAANKKMLRLQVGPRSLFAMFAP